ncbi:uncharacterized protein LOC123922770 [Trifolium pratense]|uniref:uncharacterized protein LOC123922770 n=1 Tax=Trifolium pratense TaxID=57577 RepID=UPI001E6946D4|nr:uncharacterized protein LOC123922770 [Trifolium pratense]
MGQLPFNVNVTGGSVIWNSVAKAMNKLKDGFIFKIGNGETSFWFDFWVLKERLCTVVPFVAIQDTAAKINDVWQNDMWNLRSLYTPLPNNVVTAITSIRPRIVEHLPDVWTWINSSSGLYSVKDAYIWLSNPAPLNDHVNWQWIWKLQLPTNIQFFTWQLIHGSIPVRAVLHHRRVCSTDLCPRCSVAPESIDHCLFRCAVSARLWRECGLNISPRNSHDEDNFSWYKNLGKKHGTFFFIVLWVVWCVRNDIIFNNHIESIHTSMAKIFSLKKSCDSVFSTTNTSPITSVNPRLVAWSRPTEGTMCLNVDGSLLGTTNTAGYGGLLCNNNGDFILGFYGVATVQSILFAELMAVLHGLQICWENGFRRIICFSDSLQAVNLIREGVSAHHRFANEIFSIRQLVDKDWDVVLEHTLREGNACADVLAKMGARSNLPLVKITSPPSELSMPLLADAQGVVFIRE